jgi:hypothetical protein
MPNFHDVHLLVDVDFELLLVALDVGEGLQGLTAEANSRTHLPTLVTSY